MHNFIPVNNSSLDSKCVQQFCYSFIENENSLWEELGVTAGADNTGLELWPAAAETGGPPGAHPPIFTWLKASAKMEMFSFS